MEEVNEVVGEVAGEAGEDEEEEVNEVVEDEAGEDEDSEEEEEQAVFYEGDVTDVWFVGKGGKNLADWGWNLNDVFVLIPNVRFVMFRVEMGIFLPAQKLKKFVVEKWGGTSTTPLCSSKTLRSQRKLANLPGGQRQVEGNLASGFSSSVKFRWRPTVANFGTVMAVGKVFPPNLFLTNTEDASSTSSTRESFSLRGRNVSGERQRMGSPSPTAPRAAKPLRETGLRRNKN